MSDVRIEASAGHFFFAPWTGVEDIPLSLAVSWGEKPGNSILWGKSGVRQGSSSLALAINPVVDLSCQNDRDRTTPPFCSTTSRPTI